MKAFAAEAIGTFALVFAGTGAIVTDNITGGAVTHVGIALTFGLIVMAMIYAIGEVSGAHMNPAVTLGFFLAGRMRGRLVIPYMVSQIIGAFAASLLIWTLFGNHADLGTTVPLGSASQSFGLEMVLTWILMFVILGVTGGAKETGVMAGIAIGGVIGLDALFGGPISGASMNPARSLAPAVVSGHLASLWVYIVGPVCGSAMASALWRAMRAPFKTA